MTELYLAACSLPYFFHQICPKIQGAGPGLPPSTAFPLSVRAASRFPGRGHSIAIAIAIAMGLKKLGPQGPPGATRGHLSLKYSILLVEDARLFYFLPTQKVSIVLMHIYSHNPSKSTTPSIIQLSSQTAMALHRSSSDASSAKKGLRGPGTRDRMRAGTPFPRGPKVSDNHMGMLRYGTHQLFAHITHHSTFSLLFSPSLSITWSTSQTFTEVKQPPVDRQSIH